MRRYLVVLAGLAVACRTASEEPLGQSQDAVSISLEIELDPPITTSSPSGAQKPGVPASNGSVWAFPLTGDVAGVSSAELFRVDGAGQILDASPIVLQTNLTYSGASTAVSDGADFLVLWNPVSQVGQSRAARVTAAGAVLDPGGFSAPNFSESSSAIFAGGNYWYTTGPRTLRRISQAGVLIDAMDHQFAAPSGNIFGRARLAVIGNTIAALFNEGGVNTEDFFVMRFDTNLAPIDASPILLGTKMTGMPAAIAASGSTFLLSFDDCVAHIGTTGPASAPLCTSPSIQTLTPDGANFLARSNQQVWRLDANGNRLTMPANVFGDAVSRTSIAMARGANDFVLHYLLGSTGKTANFTRFNAATLAPAPPVDRVGVPNTVLNGNIERRPEVAAGPMGWMVVWEDQRSPLGVYGVRVSGAGQPDPIAKLLVAMTPKDEPLAFAAGGQGDYMLIAEHQAIRVLANGTVAAPVALPPLPFPSVGPGGRSPRIARGASGYLVTLSDAMSSSDSKLDWNLWIDDAGNTLSGPTITAQTGTWGEYAIASNGAGYMQVLRVEDSPGQLGKLYRKTFDGAGNAVLASAQFMPADDYQSMALAFGGGVYALVYRLGGEVRAQRLDATTGALLDVGPLVVANGSEPRVAFDGTDFWVTWHATSATDYDVFARRISVGGAFVDAAPLVVSNQTTPTTPAHGHELSPSIAFGAGGDGLVAYMYDDPANTYHAFRARARLVDPMGTTTTSSSSSTSSGSSSSSSSSNSSSSASSSSSSSSNSSSSASSTSSASSSATTTSSSTSSSGGGAGGATVGEGGGGCAIDVGHGDDAAPWVIGVAIAIAARRRRGRASLSA